MEGIMRDYYLACFALALRGARMEMRKGHELEAFGWCCLAFAFLGKVVRK